MSNLDPSTTLLAEFAQRLGLPDLAFNEDGFCSVSVDGLVIEMRDDQSSGHCLLFSDLGPPAAGEAIYLTLLQANLFWRTTSGATLSLTDDEPPHVVMAYAVEWRSLDGSRLEEMFERFVQAVEDWQELLARPAQADGPGLDVIGGPDGGDGRWTREPGGSIRA